MSKNFDNTSKQVDRDRPFHRINSDNFDPKKARVSGKGSACGCRGKSDFDIRLIQPRISPEISAAESIASGLLAVLPPWVSVEREINPSGNRWAVLPEVEREVEGKLKYSQQTNEDFPLTQWHWWYDWNFFVEPAHGYEYVRGLGTHDTLAELPGLDLEEKEEKDLSEKGEDLLRSGTIECEWDCGAFGDYDFEGGHPPTLDVPGPMFNRDWAWPVGGEYIWLAGRWIYDCGHPEKGNRTRSELHPCKSIATARWEAVKFEEHEHYVPALQFMFFANSTGGYKKIEGGIADQDYEFILDLPELPEDLAATTEYPIGQKPDYPINTLVIRPRLLVKLDYEPFENARKPIAKPGEADPKVEFMPVEKPGEPPKQVKVQIPLTQLGSADRASYGVIMSLGWHDPRRAQAEKVKEVRIFFDTVILRDVGRFREFFDPEITLQFKFGVNGRWHARHFRDVRQDFLTELTGRRRSRTLGLKRLITLHLAEDDDIRIACHGMEEDPSGRLLRRSFANRAVKDNKGDPYDYDKDFDQPDNGRASRIAYEMFSSALIDFFFKSGEFAKEISDPLGRTAPGIKSNDKDTPNPLTVAELIRRTGGPGRALKGQLTARIGHYSKKPTEPNYTLTYTIEYHDIMT